MRLENEVLRVDFHPDTGGFASVFDKRLGYEYVFAPERALLFRLIVPDGANLGNHLDAAGAVVEFEGTRATIRCDLRGVQITAVATLQEDAIETQLHVVNRGSLNIEEIVFPWVRGLGPMPGSRYISPNFWLRKIDDPFGGSLGGDHHSWNEWNQKLVQRYPGHTASAWCDYGNGDHGLALEGRQMDFSMLDFFVHKVIEKAREPVRRTLDLAAVHPRRIRPGESWQSPPMRLFAHNGDWHVVADTHRQWLETWIRKPDRPAHFAEAMGWHFFFLKHQDGLARGTYADLPKMAEAALAAGCPYLLVFGWQTGGHDNSYMYRYVPNEDWGGREALQRAIKKGRAMGVEILPFFNGTLANIEMPEHKEFGYRWEAKSREGHPLYAGDWSRHNYDAPTRNRSMLHHELCPCDEHRVYFLETVQRIVQEYGFGNLQLDQIAEKMFPCYNSTHGHPHPDRAFVDGLAEVLPKTRALVRAANPRGVMISECINEFTGQWCDSSWTWQSLNFPEPILYTLPWLMMSHEVDALEYGDVNRAFAYKMHLDLKIDGGDAPITKYPKFADHVHNLADLRRRVKDYYVYGDFRDQEGLNLTARPNVIAKVFHNRSENKLGIVIAEISGRASAATLEISWKPVTGTSLIESNQRRARRKKLAVSTSLRLKPYEVCVICLNLA